MKKFFFFLLIIITFIELHSQTEEFPCGGSFSIQGSMPPNIESIKGITGIPVGGREITNQGTLRVLIVFIRFKDDLTNTTTWPDYNILPSWAQNMIDPNIPTNNIYTPGRISDFMDRASGGDGAGNLGIFKMIGDIYYVTTDENESFYNGNRTTINAHVLTKLNNTVNFSLYDNWRFMKNSQYYNHEYLPGTGDGKIDYAMFFYRNSYGTTAGHKGYYIPSNFSLDGKTFNGYGSTQFGYMNHGNTKVSITIPIHEFSHYLFSGDNITGHIDGRVVYGGQKNIGNVAWFALMLSNGGDNSFYSAYERYRAGWLNPTILNNSQSSLFLQDTHKKHKAFLIPLRYDNIDPTKIAEYYIIENFQTLNSYSTANPFLTTAVFNHSFDHGLLVFHVEQEDFNIATNSNLDIESADGLWNFYLKEGSSTPSVRDDDVLRISVPNRLSGYDERDILPLQVGPILYNDYYCLTPASCGSTCPPNHGRRYYKDAYLGDPQDFFRFDDVKVFTSFSNPRISTASNNLIYKGWEILNYNSALKEYQLSYQNSEQDVLSLSPSKPFLGFFNPGDGPIQYGWAYLAWGSDFWDEQPIESDINWSELQRKIGTNGTWVTVYSGSNRWWSDHSIIYDPQNGDTPVFFRVRVRDNQNKWSIWSNIFDTRAFMNQEGNYGVEKKNYNNLIPTINELSSNYPNPFNPTTQISYSIKENGFIRLKVYDLLGAEVATLVNETKESGYYSVEFNASELPSGVYIYTLQTGDFISSKKMILMK